MNLLGREKVFLSSGHLVVVSGRIQRGEHTTGVSLCKDLIKSPWILPRMPVIIS
jgi:hypothetical protein